MSDFAWAQGCGGILLDSLGDVQVSSGVTEIQDLVATRLKASVEGWQLYTLGANLESRIGAVINSTLQNKIQQQAAAALSDILDSSSYYIQSLVVGSSIQLYVFVNNTAIAIATIGPESVQVETV